MQYEQKGEKMQLFLLPYAGGNAFSFMKLKRFICDDIELVPIEYSGHGTRHNEPVLTDYNAFLEDVLHEIEKKKKENIPYSILGYSMGSAIALEICSAESMLVNAKHCFICAEGGLVEKNRAKEITELSRADFEETIVSFGGIEKRYLENPEIKTELLNLIYDDFLILGQFKYNGQKIHCDSTIMYSKEDGNCLNMNEWQEVCEGKTTFVEMGSSHLFIHDEYMQMAEVINSVLQKCM